MKNYSKWWNFGSRISYEYWPSNFLPYFKQLSFLEHFNSSSLSKVIIIWSFFVI